MPNIEILVPKSQFENNLNSNIVHCHQTMVIIYVNAQTQNIIVTSIGVTDHRCGWLTGISCSSSLLLSKYNFQCQRQEHIYAIIGGSSVTPSLHSFSVVHCYTGWLSSIPSQTRNNLEKIVTYL